jgi:hypothetical protein
VQKREVSEVCRQGQRHEKSRGGRCCGGCT